MPMFRLKADVKFEAESTNDAKAKLADLFNDFLCGNQIRLKTEGQISLTPTEGPLASQ
jgi:hypothetical protein